MTKNELVQYIFDTYSVEPDHPFPRDEESNVFRHGDNKKWFALTMRIPYRTLGISRDGQVDVLNVKCDPLLMGALRGKPGFHPASRMLCGKNAQTRPAVSLVEAAIFLDQRASFQRIIKTVSNSGSA